MRLSTPSVGTCPRRMPPHSCLLTHHSGRCCTLRSSPPERLAAGQTNADEACSCKPPVGSLFLSLLDIRKLTCSMVIQVYPRLSSYACSDFPWYIAQERRLLRFDSELCSYVSVAASSSALPLISSFEVAWF